MLCNTLAKKFSLSSTLYNLKLDDVNRWAYRHFTYGSFQFFFGNGRNNKFCPPGFTNGSFQINKGKTCSTNGDRLTGFRNIPIFFGAYQLTLKGITIASIS